MSGLVIVSCGSDGADAGTASSEATTAEEMNMDAGDNHSADDDSEDGHSERFAFGDPMEAADASRVIEIKALDNFTFDPASIMIEADEPNAFGLTSGEVKEMTWHFAETGEILFGCHTSGHYPAGMVGSITIAD